MKNIPNFIQISGNDKAEINMKRMIYFSMLGSMNRKKAKENFVDLALEADKKDNEEGDGWSFEIIQFHKNYPLERSN